MSTPRYLALIADQMESVAAASTSANSTLGGYWKRIALAAEVIRGEVSAANDFQTGWMRRATVAIATFWGFSGTQFNSDHEEGYLGSMVTAMEAGRVLGVGTGSWEKRFYESLIGWVP